ncbi:MAG: hypothetical protein QM756_14145 [Polyangiaceae bacterium]
MTQRHSNRFATFATTLLTNPEPVAPAPSKTHFAAPSPRQTQPKAAPARRVTSFASRRRNK